MNIFASKSLIEGNAPCPVRLSLQLECNYTNNSIFFNAENLVVEL